jgi:hypothetical protein
VAGISPFLPSRIAGELGWAAAFGRGWSSFSLAALVAYAVLGCALCLWAYRRNEKNYG